MMGRRKAKVGKRPKSHEILHFRLYDREEKELRGENAMLDTEFFRRIISAGRLGPKTAKKSKIGKSTIN